MPYGPNYSALYPYYRTGTSVPTVPTVQGQYYQQAAPQPQPQIPMEGAKWVQGEIGARAYPVQPGRMAILMDSEDSIFYMKSVDIYGVPMPLRKFRFTEIVEEQKSLPQGNSTQMDVSNFITKDEFDQKLKEKLEELMK